VHWNGSKGGKRERGVARISRGDGLNIKKGKGKEGPMPTAKDSISKLIVGPITGRERG